MSGIVYYIVDTETTGLSSSYNETIEISIVRCHDRVQLTEFIKCDYPERASFDALAIQNKTMADLDKGKSKEEVIEKVNKFLNEDGLTPGHRCFVAHNWTFDKRFIHALYEKIGQKCPVDLWLCSMALTKQFIKNAGLDEDAKKKGLPKLKVNLHSALDLVGVQKLSAAHASKVDSRNTYLLWKDLVENKGVDYLPFIKTAEHIITPKNNDDDEGLDMSLLDL